MTKQEWIKEMIAEGVALAIVRFKKEKPFAIHQIAIDAAKEILLVLHSQGVVIKVDRDLKNTTSETEEIKSGIINGLRAYVDNEANFHDVMKVIVEAGYGAFEPLIEEKQWKTT